MSTELLCPNCNNRIESININISTDLAKCSVCDTISKVSSLVYFEEEKVSETPPVGSIIQLSKERGDTIKLLIPKKGFTVSTIPVFVFSMFWLGFIAFWTWGAAQGNIYFALFSIPFWLIGFGMLIGQINSMFETQTLSISKYELVLEKKRPFIGKRFGYKISEIHDIKNIELSTGKTSNMSKYNWINKKSIVTGLEYPAIISDYDTTYFFESTTNMDKDWVTKYLSNKLKSYKK